MILFTASNFTFSQTKPIFNLILCIILGIFSLSLFVTAFISGREIDMITLIPSSLILAVTAFAVGHSYYVEKQYEFCPNCHYQYQVYEQYDYCPQCNTKLTNKCDNCHKELPDEAIKACPYCGKEIEFKVGDIPNDSN
ncbi:MAG: zinc ribbon domain-containing protein [Hominilimicola sp.]